MVDPSTRSLAASEHALAQRGSLPTDWRSGHPLIDDEHQALLKVLQRLPEICESFLSKTDCHGCLPAAREACEARLVGLLGEVIEFVIEHFSSEEAIMRRSLLPALEPMRCEAHFEDHAEIMGRLTEILGALSPETTAGRIRDLNASLQHWLHDHILHHDQPLAEWLKRDEMLLSEI